MSDSLRPHGLQHTRLPCPSQTPEACWNSCPSSQWRHPTFSSSDVPFTSCLQSFPASGTFPMSQFFTSVGLSLDMFTPEGVSRGGRDGRWGWAVNYHLGGPKMMCGRSGIQTQVGAIMFRQERILLITTGGKESWGSSHVIVSSLCGWRWDDLQGVRRLRGDCRCEESGNLFQQGQLSVGEQAPESPCGVLLSFVQKLRSRQREDGWLNMSRTRI